MVKLYRAAEARFLGTGEYGRRYVADLQFKRKLDAAGATWVKVPGGMKTDAHKHEQLEEVFVFVDSTRMRVDKKVLELKEGDVVVVEPGESHWFETPEGHDVRFVALKCPNLKTDRVDVPSPERER
jgi:mannose-6-phosphate isomerase-like protein (cupin superfamily)